MCEAGGAAAGRIIDFLADSCQKFLTQAPISANISYRKRCCRVTTVRLSYMVQKSNLTLVGAVAFLMSFIFFGLPDTNPCDNDTDDCHCNTDKFQNHFEHQKRLPFTLFSICIPSFDTGSSQNVLILAKGEPLPVLATPESILS